MKRVTVLLLIFSFSLIGATPALAQNNAEPAYVNEEFTRPNWVENWHNINARNNIEKAKGFEGPGLKVSIPKGSHFGSEFSYSFESDVEQLYFRYFLRFDNNFNTHASGGKIPGPAGVYGNRGLGCKPSLPGSPGWSARMMWFGDRKVSTLESTRIGYYTYHLDQAKDCGDAMMWNEYGSLKHGEWYCVEGHIKLNTPGEHNGVLKGWVNGQTAFSRNDIAFRRETESNIDIRNFWFNIYFGGKRTPPEEQSITFDGVALSSNKIGCPAYMLPGWEEAEAQRLAALALLE